MMANPNLERFPNSNKKIFEVQTISNFIIFNKRTDHALEKSRLECEQI